MEADVLKRIKEMPLFLLTMLALVAGGVLLLALPAREFSELENRPLAAWDGSSLLQSGFDEKAEKYLSDQFPGRDALIMLDAAVSVTLGQRLQDGVLLGSGGYLLEEPVAEVTATARSAMDTVEEIAQTLQLPVNLLLVPTSAAALPHRLPPLYEAADQARVLDALYAMAEQVQPVDSGLLRAADPDTRYYRTDHHLTAEGAWTVYAALCAEWGLEPLHALRTELTGFRGSYYARIPDPRIGQETFSAELPAGLTLTVDGAEQPFLREEALSRRNKYGALIGETYAHAVITGGAGEEALLVVSDSYANAIVPLLAQHFRRVDVIDPRYYAGVVSALAQEAGSTRVLALYGLNTFSTNRGLALLSIGGE